MAPQQGDEALPVHTAADHRFAAMPLGGIGTGNLAIGSDGGLRQWQLHNVGNHLGDLPGSFFAVRVSCHEPPLDAVRVLQAPVPEGEPTILVTDDRVPAWQRDLVARRGGIAEVSMSAVYPEARLRYRDPGLPVSIDLVATTPMVPLDVERSSIPVATFTFSVTNHGDQPAGVWLGQSQQNPIGWDGLTPIDGVRAPSYGGNTNRVLRTGGWTQLICENPALDPTDPGAGQLVVAVDSPNASVLAQYDHPDQFLDFLQQRQWGARPLPAGTPQWADAQPHRPSSRGGASPTGSTWLGGVARHLWVAPGATEQVRFQLAWHLPNRYQNWLDFGPAHPERMPSRFWVGNAYATRFANAEEVARSVATDWDDLHADSRAWIDTLVDSDLDPVQTERIAAQAAYVRSPTCFQTADGTFYGHEGVLGESTTMWAGSVGGSCPLNCTHVWNYAQALSGLFPTLELSMRDTEFDVTQHPSGYLPHRTIAPSHLPQLWGVDIGGPEEPALDGMLGGVLKTYREVLRLGDLDWLRARWERVVALLDHVEQKWDPTATGMLHGVQPSTHDIDLTGLNSYMGTFWLAALRAAEEMATLLGETGRAEAWRTVFERGSTGYDDALFSTAGDGPGYYVQVLEEGDSEEFQWRSGCLSDQVIGQWWAHQLGLGHLLPVDHVRSALRAVVAHNFKPDFTGFSHGYRTYADHDDAGLLMVTWPRGGRPAVPTRYCDEVWTGIEYQVAAHCLMEGLVKEGEQILAAMWRRHDGRRRNPWNEIECGDHYARAMAGWSVLEGLSGARHDAVGDTLTVAGGRDGSWPLITRNGFGLLHRAGDQLRLEARHGTLDHRVTLTDPTP